MKLNGKRLRQYKVLMMFLLFDVISTLIFIKDPYEEISYIPRYFMIYFNNNYLGLITYYISLSIVLYYVIASLSNLELLSDNAFHYFFMILCAYDFGYAATSWFWKIYMPIKVLIGGIFYLLIDKYWISLK